MQKSDRPIILIFGASGFVGRNLCKRFFSAGFVTVSISRRNTNSEFCTHELELTSPCLAILEEVRMKYPRSTMVCISAIGRGREKKNSEIYNSNYCINRELLDATRSLGRVKFLYISGFGIPSGKNLSSESYYYSKGLINNYIKQNGKGISKILSPSYIVGPEDEFSSYIKKGIGGLSLVVPGSGSSRIQPIHIDSFTQIVQNFICKRRKFNGQEMAILGPEVSFRTFVEATMRGVSPKTRISFSSLEAVLKEAVFDAEPNWSMAELAIMFADVVGDYRADVCGVHVEDWPQLLSRLHQDYRIDP